MDVIIANKAYARKDFRKRKKVMYHHRHTPRSTNSSSVRTKMINLV